MTSISKETWEETILDGIPYIHYLVQFKKDEVRALIESSSKINAITPAYVAKLDFRTCYINVATKKIDCYTFPIFGIVLANFRMKDKL